MHANRSSRLYIPNKFNNNTDSITMTDSKSSLSLSSVPTSLKISYNPRVKIETQQNLKLLKGLSCKGLILILRGIKQKRQKKYFSEVCQLLKTTIIKQVKNVESESQQKKDEVNLSNQKVQ